MPSESSSRSLGTQLAALRARLRDSRLRLAHQLVLLIESARSALGIRRGLHTGGCYYKELSAVRLGRALAARRPGDAPGYKDYRVTFAGGSKMLIRCSRDRCYADLMGDEGLFRYNRIGQILRPGSRILEIATPPMSTGYTAAWLARMAGDSGAVVSLMPDEQGARFAQRRYDAPNLSIETIALADDSGAAAISQTLSGETDHSFHAIVHLGLPAEPRHRDHIMRELWRVLAPGGWLLAGVRLNDDPSDQAIQSLRRHLTSLGQVVESGPAPLIPPDLPPNATLDILLRKHPPANPAA